MKHIDIKRMIIDTLESRVNKDALYSDRRPTVLEEGNFSAVVTFLTDAGHIGEGLDAGIWQATLHIEIFLPVQVPDSELDDWMELCICSVLGSALGLSLLINNMVQQGYDYQCGDDFGLWSSADLKYSIAYGI